jgi:ankyrin repeat protein
VRFLLLAGVATDRQTQLCRTALHLAARAGNVEVVPLLLRAGAEKNTRTDGETALHLAIQKPGFKVMFCFLNGKSTIWHPQS